MTLPSDLILLLPLGSVHLCPIHLTESTTTLVALIHPGCQKGSGLSGQAGCPGTRCASGQPVSYAFPNPGLLPSEESERLKSGACD